MTSKGEEADNKLETLRFLVLFGYMMGLFKTDLFWFLWKACRYE